MPLKKLTTSPEHSIALTDDEFWSMFAGDLRQVTSHVVIYAPYLWDERLDFVASFLRGFIERGGIVCVFVKMKRGWDWRGGWSEEEHADLVEFQRRLELLLSWGVHVNLKKNVHQKIAILDGKVHYEGSLNMLSHGENGENMRRFSSESEATLMKEKHGTDLCVDCVAATAKHSIGANDESQFARIGAALKRRRLALGMSQEKVANHAGISRSRYGQLEKFCNASLPVYFKLLSTLGMTSLIVLLRDIQPVASFQERLEMSRFEQQPDLTLLRKRDGVYRDVPEKFHPKRAFASKTMLASNPNSSVVAELV